tara:strand:- start:34 stop:564 length:531 start_codon:yes stop_codon:yes gene_type:complete
MKKRASEFSNVGEIIKFIESEKDIKIKLEAYEYWSGVIQLKNENQSEGVDHFDINDLNGESAVSVKNGKVTIGEDYEGYDIKKRPLETKFYNWGSGEIDKDEFLTMLNDFINVESNDSDFNEFIDHYVHSEDYDETFETFEAENTQEGCGQEFGVDHISWKVFQDINEFSVDFLLS